VKITPIRLCFQAAEEHVKTFKWWNMLEAAGSQGTEVDVSFSSFKLSSEPQMLTPTLLVSQAAEDQVKTLKRQSAFLSQLAAKTVPKGLHCLSQRLTVQHSNLPPEERWLRPEQSRLEVSTTNVPFSY
jgi:hypothetical protein